jgi:hypothetical protein
VLEKRLKAADESVQLKAFSLLLGVAALWLSSSYVFHAIVWLWPALAARTRQGWWLWIASWLIYFAVCVFGFVGTMAVCVARDEHISRKRTFYRAAVNKAKHSKQG